MWWRFLLYLAVIYGSYSQSLSEVEDNARTTRQAECCPCPKDMDSLPEASSWKLGAGSGAGLGAVDDCPCRARSADAEGASSILVPSSVHAFRPLSVRPTDLNEEPKPLLHPEVDLASSVLETLREATDEEYQDAVARDAARSAASDPLDNENSNNIVTIIVKPKEVDDTIPEASHVQQTRCIHPLTAIKPRGYTNMKMSQRPHVLKEIFSAPKIQSPLLHRNVFDIDSSGRASNVREHYIDRDSNFDLKSNPSAWSPLLERPSLRDSIIKNSKDVIDNKNKAKLIPNLRLESTSDKLIERSNEIKPKHLSRLPAIPILKLKPNPDLKINREALHQESKNVPLSGNTDGQILDKISSKNLLPKHNLKSFLPLTLKNLHKLKDVELIAPKKLSTNSLFKKRTNIPDFKLTPFLRNNNNNNAVKDVIDQTISKPSKFIKSIPLFKKNEEMIGSNSNIKTSKAALMIPKHIVTETRTLNNLKSASEDHPVVIDIENTEELLRPINSDIGNCDLNSQSSNIASQIDQNISKPNEIMNNIPTFNPKDLESNNQIESGKAALIIPVDKVIQTRILNNLPSASEDHPVAIDTKKILPEEERPISSEIGNCDLNSESSNIASQNIEKDISSDTEPILHEKTSNHLDDLSQTQHASNAFNPILENQFEEESCSENTNINDSVGDTSNNIMQVESNSEFAQSHITTIVENPNVESTCTLDQINSKEIIDDTLSNGNEELVNDVKHSNHFEDDAVSEEISDVNNHENFLLADESNAICVSKSSALSTDIPENSQTDLPKNISNGVDIDDLQIMSDSLLNKSNAKDNGDAASEPVADINCVLKPMSNVNSGDENNRSATQENEDSLLISKSVDRFDSSLQKKDKAEMVGAASESSPNTYATGTPASFLNNILSSSLPPLRQPTLLDDLVLFPRPRSEPELNILTSHLPSLTDIKNTLSNILDAGARNSEDDDISLAETHDDCSNEESSMFTDATTTKSKSTLPSSKSLKEIDLNIFQLQPLTMPLKGPKSLKIPTLNLNTYKAKLAVPNSMDFRPLKLESSLGKNGGILGATLTLDADKIKAAHSNKISQHLKKSKTGILGTLDNLPSLDDIRERARSHLLSIPQISDPHDLFGNGFDVSEPLSDLTENLKEHSDNTLRNIQKSLGSTFHEPKLKESILKPNHFLQRLSEAHEDVNDKLYGLHVDFSDRLSSFRDSILEKSRIPLLSQPLFSNFQTFRSSKNKSATKSPRAKLSESNKKYKLKSPAKIVEPASYFDTRKKIKMPTASSSTNQKIVSPYNKITNSLQKSNQKVSNISPTTQIITKQHKIFNSAPATTRPKLKFVPKSISSFPKPEIKKSSIITNQQPSTKQRNSLERWAQLRSIDSNGSPSELVPSKLLPNEAEYRKPVVKESSFKSATPKPTLNLKPIPKLRLSGPKDNEDSINLFAWPKITESSFLNKVRDAVIARIASLNPTKTEEKRVEDDASVDRTTSSDMVRSASENTEVTKCGKCDEIVNDNVSFKCKMVCVKEN